MKMNARNILIAAILLLIAGCQKIVEYDNPLSLSAERNILPATSGSTPIIVYANDSWTASLAQDCTWGKIDTTKGQGLGQLIFSWEENKGIARTAKLTVTSGDLSQTIELSQKSAFGDVSLAFPYSSVSTANYSGIAHLPFSGSVADTETGDMKVEVTDAEGNSVDWISEVAVFPEEVTFHVAKNDSGAPRKAKVRLSYEDKAAVKASAEVEVIQTLESGFLTFTENVTAREFLSVPYTVNLPFNTNMHLFLPQLMSSATSTASWMQMCPFKVGQTTLDVAVSANDLDEARTAEIRLSYTDEEGETCTFRFFMSQKAKSEPVTMEQLKAMIEGADGTLKLKEEGVLEAVVISDCSNPNIETNPNTEPNVIDYTLNWRTAYLTTEDGTSGIRVVFESEKDNELEQGDKIWLDLDGVTLEKQGQPDRYTVSGLTLASIAKAGVKAEVKVREKTISELVDSDIYTMVKLKGLEFTFKHGSYTNCHDGYQRQLRLPSYPNALGEAINYGGSGAGYHFSDATPCSLRDAHGHDIYTIINNEAPWRRYGNGVPQGTNDLTGIIVHSVLPRWAYNGDLGRYSIRLMDEKDIVPTGEAFSSTVIEWNWGEGAGQLSRREATTPTYPESPAYYSVTSNMDDVQGTVFNENTSPDYNNLVNYIKDDNDNNKGVVYCGDIAWTLSSGPFWATTDLNDMEGAPWFCFGFSTAGLSGSNIVFNWTAVQGSSRSAADNIFAPSLWKVEYSTDGETFTATDRTYAIHPAVWYKEDCLANAINGMHMYSTALPASLIDQERVYVRVRAASNDTKSASGNRVRFGEISVQYN